jgi:hypothetical protein
LIPVTSSQAGYLTFLGQIEEDIKRFKTRPSGPPTKSCMHLLRRWPLIVDWDFSLRNLKPVVINNSWNRDTGVQVAIPSTESIREVAVSNKNLVAAIVIFVVIIGGGAVLYKMDDGRGARTSSDITAKTASD